MGIVMRAYVLVETAVGKAMAAERGIQGLDLTDTKTLSVDVVTGPYDMIVQLESADLDKLGQAILTMQQVEGLQRTTTCLVVRLV